MPVFREMRQQLQLHACRTTLILMKKRSLQSCPTAKSVIYQQRSLKRLRIIQGKSLIVASGASRWMAATSQTKKSTRWRTRLRGAKPLRNQLDVVRKGPRHQNL